MKQAIKLYGKIKSNQIILIALLGILVACFVGGINTYYGRSITNIGSDEGLGGFLLAIMLLASGASVYTDQTRHLNTWLSTQNVSRRQIFLSKLLWMVIGPILFSNIIDFGMSLASQTHNLSKVLDSNLDDSLEGLFLVSLVVLVSIILGPIWPKVIGSIFVLIVSSSIFELGANYIVFDATNVIDNKLITCFGILILLSISYYIVGTIGVESEHEIVRIPVLKWPIVVFVFLSTFVFNINENAFNLNSFILPVVLGLITFIFVFKPKLSWQK